MRLFGETADGIIAYFQPTTGCQTAINYISAEYSEKVISEAETYAEKPRKISKCIHAGLVYFPGNIIIDPLMILIPLSVVRDVELGGKRVGTDHYYHVLDWSQLKVEKDAKLVAVVISDIK
ncbi:hypothetical protein ACJ73_01653 [Blastomyces percursus]|uniref:Uncharacterized protein n=1 Tax=Blastomyces percursus TaxID=1658174 RepID=A0A1J9RED7_9EURO|nr:hypothetical protein ACJ73_01653 [Blastomyces percursus]